jgi:hypothetical protein
MKRYDKERRDVTDLPGLWDESDTIEVTAPESVWVMHKTVTVHGEEAQCYNCEAETPINRVEILGVMRMPAGTPFDVRLMRKHLAENYGDMFAGVCFSKMHDITVPADYLNEVTA